ncbi:Os07g0189400, partial [Oryza sativa Japonica Group]
NFALADRRISGKLARPWRCPTTCSRPFSGASRRGASPRPAASARSGAASSTAAACCARTSSRSRWPASSSTTTAPGSRSSSPAPPPPPPSPAASTTPCLRRLPTSTSRTTATASSSCSARSAAWWWLTPPRGSGSSCPRPITIIIPYLQPWAVDCNENEYLVFDPTRSPNYELFMVPKVPYKLREEEECEWPPSTLILPVFSSKTGSWEERAFDREGDAAGTLPAMVGSTPFCDHQCGYWRGALYVCFSDCFVMRYQLESTP